MHTGPKPFPARVDQLPQVCAFVEACASGAGLGPRRIAGLLVALEEVFVNICNHAYPGGVGMAEVDCETTETGLVLEIADQGPPFDPLSLPDPDLTLELDERPVGGLGVLLVRRLANEVSWRREEGRNILRLTFGPEDGSSR